MEELDKKVVIFGGGTGLSTLLRGLKRYPVDITAVVTVSDDGGSSGVLRELFNMAPPGDIRRVLVSLSKDESRLSKLFNYRFDKSLGDHTIGNIVLAALYDINNKSMTKAIEDVSKILNIKGRVLPISEDLYKIKACFMDGSCVQGETNIISAKKRIRDIEPIGTVHVNKSVIEAINEADFIIYSTGSLYTSLLPNLVLPEVKEALKESKAYKIYVANVMTQIGETSGYKLSDHVKAVIDVVGEKQLDCVLANDMLNIDQEILQKYYDQGSELVYPDIEETESLGTYVETSRLISVDDGLIRHNPNKVAANIARKIIDIGG